MATYYQGGASEIQAGDNNLQTLYLMNPNLITTTTTTPDYSDQTHQHHNHHQQQQQQQQHIMLNPTVTPNTLTHGIIPQHHHPQLVGIPLAGPHHHSASGADLSRADLSRTSLQHHNHHLNQMASAINGLVGPRAHYASTGLWSPASDTGPAQSGPIQDFPGQGQGQARGGLSLSLSPGLQRARAEGDDGRMSVTLAGPGPGPGPMVGSKYLKAAQELLEEVVNVADNNNNVGGGDHNNNNNNNMESSKGKAVVEEGGGDDVAGGGDGGESSKKGGELSMAQRHELQMKKAKLLNMLDEVDQRYRQYNTQMQIIASSFEQAAGIGSAKSYTSLALKTISKQFRTLKDAISSQIKAANKSLGEENIVGVKLEGGGGVGSRLRLVDQQISQHRALQQLGMMQPSHNAWRPQRGLPERAVSVLRAWLFEHFLHPYPKDSDKHMLAKQTGLTRSQVSNWFINARVRLWKPMVEEMYVEEMKSHEQNNIIPTDDTTTTTTTTNNGGEIGGSSSKNERNQDLSTTNKTIIITQQQHQQPQQEGDLGFDNNQQTTNDMISSLSTMSTTSPQGFTLIGSSSDMETLMARSQKKHRSNNNNNSDMNSPSSILSMDMEMKPIDHQQQQPKYGQYSSSMTSIHGGTGYNNPYIMNNNHNNIGRLFSQNQLTTASYHGNAVALTLGLPHCDNSNNNNNNNNGNNISLSENHHQQNFFPSNQGMDLGRRVEIGANEGDFCGSNIGGGGHETSHPSNNVVYESIDIQSRKRFAAQILHDFVA